MSNKIREHRGIKAKKKSRLLHEKYLRVKKSQREEVALSGQGRQKWSQRIFHILILRSKHIKVRTSLRRIKCLRLSKLDSIDSENQIDDTRLLKKNYKMKINSRNFSLESLNSMSVQRLGGKADMKKIRGWSIILKSQIKELNLRTSVEICRV